MNLPGAHSQTHSVLGELSEHEQLLVVLASKDAEIAALKRQLADQQTELDESNRRIRANSSPMAVAAAVTGSKDFFLASISHEIRTPLNGILGMLDLVLGSAINDEQREYLGSIRRSTKSLLRILNDVLDYSKLCSNQVELESRPFSLSEVLNDVLQVFGPNARGKGLALWNSVAAGIPELVKGDDLRLRQVLWNLVDNAIKFTHRGRIDVAVTGTETSSGRWDLWFEVSDTGVGMSPEQISRLFLPYSQAEASTSRRYGGTGLGLAISKNLVELMDGEIEVDSREGQGSVFRFRLPFETVATQLPVANARRIRPMAPPPHAVEKPPQEAPGRRVLLVEDNEINQKVARLSLEHLGWTVDIAGNGLDAIEAARSKRYEVICMDLTMPEMDGLEATRRIRRLPCPSTGATIIATTGHASTEDRKRCLEAGMDDFLSKPFEVSQLKETLDRACAVARMPTQRRESLRRSA